MRGSLLSTGDLTDLCDARLRQRAQQAEQHAGESEQPVPPARIRSYPERVRDTRHDELRMLDVYKRQPLAFAANAGVPPTELKARTGEFTPPGITARERSNSFSLASWCSGWVEEGVIVSVPFNRDG